MALIMLVPLSRLVGNPLYNVTKPIFSNEDSDKMTVTFTNSNYSYDKEPELVNKQHRAFFSIYAKHYSKMPKFKFKSISDTEAEFTFEWNTESGDNIKVKYILKENVISLQIFPSVIFSFRAAEKIIPQIIREFKTHKWIEDDYFYGIGRKALTSEWEKNWYKKYKWLECKDDLSDIIDRLVK